MLLRALSILSALCLAGIVRAAPVDLQSRRPDGSPIYWSLDRQGGGSRQGILVLAQGSGCNAASENGNIAKFKALLPDFAVLTVEKWGVKPHARPRDPYEGCDPAFYAHHTVSQRALDYRRILQEVEAQPWWDGRLVLFGGSEGGAAVSALAPTVNPTAIVVFSTAPGRNLGESFKRAMPPAVALKADAEFARIRAHPTSPRLFGGNSYVWWADILRLDLTSDLLATKAPILLVQGDSDTSAAAEEARTVRDDFHKAGHSNLTYWEFPGYDHQMHDQSGVSHLDTVMRKISDWLRTQLIVDTPKTQRR